MTTSFTSEIDLVIECPRWESVLNDEDFRLILNSMHGSILAHAEIPSAIKGRCLSYCIILSDDGGVETLNLDYRGIDKPTNVLSFAVLDDVGELDFLDMQEQFEGAVTIGDLVLSYDTLMREAKEKSISFESHFYHLLTHGVLHLLGYDHIDDDEAEIMEGLEIVILKSLGIDNPYAEL